MKNIGIMKIAQIIMVVLVMLVLLPGRCYSWAPATHAHIEKHLYKQKGKLDDNILNNRIYGAVALDIFNFSFDPPYPQCAAYLHDLQNPNFLKVWRNDNSRLQKAFAYGYVSHNNTWGMDSTAHVAGITFGRDNGYVITKARLLAGMLKNYFPPLEEGVLEEVCHYLVEYGVELLVLNKDPDIGVTLSNAAIGRDSEVPALLVNAFAEDFSAFGVIDAEDFIITAESNFQQVMVYYGSLLNPASAFDNIAQFLADFGKEYLGIPSDVLLPLITFGLQEAMNLCDSDFEKELRAATGWVNGKLSSNDISW